MAIPKNFRKDLNILKEYEGFEQRQNLFNKITEKQGYLPKGITYEDMDREFIDFVKNKLEIVVEGKKVPVYIVSIQRWYEFYTTWENSDEFGNITLPFIVITRDINVQKGTTHSTNYNIPGFITWAYIKVPSTDGIRNGYDIYKIPQPVPVDIQYEVRFFSKSIRQLNVLNSKVQTLFSARQTYVNVNGNPMPLLLESINEESMTENVDQRKYYVQSYTMKLLGYLLNESDFEVVPAVNRTILFTEVREGKKRPVKVFEGVINKNQDINITFNFNGSVLDYETEIINPANYINIVTNNINSYIFLVNNNLTTIPFIVNSGDILKVIILNKNNNDLPCSITFIGLT